MVFWGCWCCYHHFTTSQFGGDSKGRRARGYYGTYKVHCCGKRWGKDVSAFYRCEYHDINGGLGIMTGVGIMTGAGFEGYNPNKVKGRVSN